MQRIVIFAVLLLTTFCSQAQKSAVKPLYGQTFWKEDFNSGKLPSGWAFICKNDSTVNWMVTDQPFPGSNAHAQQAPPIASNSRSFHLQYAPGVRVDKAYRK